MDAMLPSRIGKLRIVCSLPLFSDAICIKSQSAAEHGFTQVSIAIALAQALNLSPEDECEFLELVLFAEMPKCLLGDPSHYLRQRHPEAKAMYEDVRGRLWSETEESLKFKTTRNPGLVGLHHVVDSFAAMLFIEKECLLGNQYFASERYKTKYHKYRNQVLKGVGLAEKHPAQGKGAEAKNTEIDWKKAISFLDNLYDDCTRSRLEGGVAEYSATFLGMIEKLKEHYRYKGWSYHYAESVAEHTFQVIFLAHTVASALSLPNTQRIELYRLAALHDLAEAYASDVIYPVKVREKDLGKMHAKLEEEVIKDLCKTFGVSLPNNKLLDAIVDICDRFSAQIYFDRERRSGNSHFNVKNVSMDHVKAKYGKEYPEIFLVLEELWEEYLACFK